MSGATRYTDGGISPRTNVYAAGKMLMYAGPVLVLEKFGAMKEMPKNKTQTIKFRRPKVFAAVTAPLVEGVTPTATRFQYEDVPATLRQYGMVVEITDVIEDTHEDPVLNDATEQSGDNIGRTVEKLTYGVVKAGTNAFYANGTARNAVNTTVSLNKQRKVIRALKAQKAMKFTKVLDGSVKFKTQPIEACYPAVGHTDCESDIRNLQGFVPVSEYGARNTMSPHEIGAVEDVRYVLSPDLDPWIDAGGAYADSGTDMVSTSGTSADVYPLLYFGKEGFGCVPLRGFQSVDPTIISAGQKTKDDPLGQRGYVGWKTWFTAVILNQLWLARLETAVTDL